MCHAQQVRKVAQAAKAAAISLPALVAAHPALALVSCQWSGVILGQWRPVVPAMLFCSRLQILALQPGWIQ